MRFPFTNTYSQLPPEFFERTSPLPVSSPSLIAVNDELAIELGIDPEFLRSDEGLSVLSGNQVPEGAEPLAMAYAGHQFGGFSPQLGDGRAILLGELHGKDLQLKGAGRTPYSRRGDGRSALGPVIREYLVSEAMHALGIPSTRALAMVESGEQVQREELKPGGILTRVASSHLRIGTVQFFAARGDHANLEALVSYAKLRHYPDLSGALDLLRKVIEKQASLIAQWMSVGFIHGVMNTDNMSLSGETIDYGPCAFMDRYDPAQRFSYIDKQGRYAYQNQAYIAQWNLSRLAEALLPLIDKKQERAAELARNELAKFPVLYESARLRLFSKKIGLPENPDWELIQSFLDLLEEQKADFTLAFRSLSQGRDALLSQIQETQSARSWLIRWEATGVSDPLLMDQVNPAFIPRNHRIENVIQAADHGNFTPFHELHEILKRPYSDQKEFTPYQDSPAPHEIVCATFCGT